MAVTLGRCGSEGKRGRYGRLAKLEIQPYRKSRKTGKEGQISVAVCGEINAIVVYVSAEHRIFVNAEVFDRYALTSVRTIR
jgi:hypothetical protein